MRESVHVCKFCADYCATVRREYVEALEREMQEKRQKATLDTMISEASAVVSGFIFTDKSIFTTLIFSEIRFGEQTSALQSHQAGPCRIVQQGLRWTDSRCVKPSLPCDSLLIYGVPAYPEDDRLENDLQMAQGRYNEIQGYLNRESQAVNLLKAANGAMAGCARQINEALSYSTWGARHFAIQNLDG